MLITQIEVRISLIHFGFYRSVVRYFSGERDEMPDSCDSFVRMDDENSRLAQNCATWANDDKWGHVSYNVGENRLYNYAAFVADSYHWISTVDKRMCDDNISNNLSTGDFWKVYVR